MCPWSQHQKHYSSPSPKPVLWGHEALGGHRDASHEISKCWKHCLNLGLSGSNHSTTAFHGLSHHRAALKSSRPTPLTHMGRSKGRTHADIGLLAFLFISPSEKIRLCLFPPRSRKANSKFVWMLGISRILIQTFGEMFVLYCGKGGGACSDVCGALCLLPFVPTGALGEAETQAHTCVCRCGSDLSWADVEGRVMCPVSSVVTGDPPENHGKFCTLLW